MSKMESKAVLGKSSALYFIALLSPKLVGVILLPLYSNYIDPDEFGIFGYTTSIVTVLSFLSTLGLNTYYLRFYPKTEDKRNLNGTMFWFMLAWNVVLFAIELLVMPLIWKMLNVSFSYWPYVPLALLTQFFVSIETIPMRTFRIKGEVKLYLLRVLVKCALLLVLSVVLLVTLRLGCSGRYLADLINALLFSIVFIIYMCKNAYFRIDRKLLKSALKFSLPLVPADILANSVPLGVTTMIESFLSQAQLGLYSMGYQITMVLSTITTSISYAIEPEFYLRAGTKDFPDISRSLKNIQFVVIAWVCMGCVLFIEEVEMLLLSVKYDGTWQIVQILALSSMVSVLTGFLTTHAILQSQTKKLIWAHLGNLITVVLLGFILYPHLGYSALGWPNFAGSLVVFAIMFMSVDHEKIGKVQFTRDYLVIVVTAATALLSRMLHTLPLYASFAAKLIFFVAFTTVLPRVYGFSLQDLVKKASSMIRSKRGK